MKMIARPRGKDKNILINSESAWGFACIEKAYKVKYKWPPGQLNIVLSCCYIVIYTFMQQHNDTTIKTQEGKRRKKRRKKTSLQLYLPLILLQGFERVVQGLHVRGCWRPNINFIF